MRLVTPTTALFSLTNFGWFLGQLRQAYSFVPTEKSVSCKSQRQLIASNTIASKMSSGGPNDEANQGETIGQMYGGLVFLKTKDRKTMVEFYKSRIGMVDWLEQPNITILQHGNMILGFHQPPQEPIEVDVSGMYTFVYPSREQVDEMYSKLKDIADGAPRVNPTYKIYQFFAKDPEGRDLEFQAFLHPLSIATSQP